MKEPNFRTIPPVFIESAWESWEQGDASGICALVGHETRGQLLMDNIKSFTEKGIYEAAFFETYIHGPHFPIGQWRFLLSFADRAKLLACGDQHPTAPTVVYRGISHHGHRGWIRGISWTTNPGTAAWFANRWSRPGHTPAVYSLTVKPEDILFVTNDRAEDEVAVASWQCGRMKRLDPMPPSVKPG